MRPAVAAVGVEWIALSPRSARRAERRVVACQACSYAVSRPFSSLLVEALGAGDAVGRYVLGEAAHCPNCHAPIMEDTLVRAEAERLPGASAVVFERLDGDREVVFVDEPHLAEAQAWISGCEHCSGDVGVAFDYILDAVTESDPATSDYVMCRMAECPSCHSPVTEKTRVVAGGEEFAG